jgi:hypothetical protein
MSENRKNLDFEIRQPLHRVSEEILAQAAELLGEVEARRARLSSPREMRRLPIHHRRGRVRVHDGEMTLNYLGRRDVFGEMAALDPEPRSATVTAGGDSPVSP